MTCLLEWLFDSMRFSTATKLSIATVLVGVSICTVSDMSVNMKGFMAAGVAVWSTALQQYVRLGGWEAGRLGLYLIREGRWKGLREWEACMGMKFGIERREGGLGT